MVAISFSMNSIFAVGAYPEPQVVIQPDGTRLTVQLNGDEWFNWVGTTDGYRIVRNQIGVFEYAVVLKSGDVVPSGIKVNEVANRTVSEKEFLSTLNRGPGLSSDAIRSIREARRNGALKSSTASSYFSTKGTQKLLVILANFSDTNPSYSRDAFDNYMNQPNYNGTGSFRDYYLENSLGQLEVNSIVTEWVTLPKTHDYYGPRTKWGEFAYAAIQAAHAQGVDFSQFDNDGDGIVEGIAIIHQGPGQEVTGNETDIWSHSWSLSSAGYSQTARTFNNVIVNQYTTQPETRNTLGSMNTIGVICHEFGHNLGAPDFYDTDSEDNGQYFGTGRWDLMASGSYNGTPSGSKPAHHNPYTKISYNWITPTVINMPATHTLEPVLTTGQVFRINSPVDNEYLLLENRQLTGFDLGLPGKGMLVYHVDGTWINTYRNSNKINIGEHQGLYPVAAGGIINAASCPFPGAAAVTQLTDDSSPAMKTWSGLGFNRSLSGITESNGNIYFDFMAFQNGSPLSLVVEDVSHSSLHIQWEPSNLNLPVLLAYSEDGVFGNLVNGTVYSPGETIPGGGKVLYYGSEVKQFLHEGLEASTKYYYSVWSKRDDSWTSPLKSSGLTTALPVSTFPWVEDFESGLTKWRSSIIVGEYQWSLSTEGVDRKPASAYEGDKFSYFYAPVSNNPTARMVSPVLNLESNKDYVLEFRHYQAKGKNNNDNLRVLIKKEGTDIWEEIALYDEEEVEWIERRIYLPYSQSVKIAFEGIGKMGYGVAVDNVIVKEFSNCSITGVSVTDATTQDVNLSAMTLEWSRAQGDGVMVVARKGGKVLDLPDNGEVFTANPAFGDGSAFGNDAFVVYVGTGNSVALTNLEHSSDYHFAFFAYHADGWCYQVEPDRFVFTTEMKIHNIQVKVTDGTNPLADATVTLDGELKTTDEDGFAEWQIVHREAYASISVSYPGMETWWGKVYLNNSREINVSLSVLNTLAPTGLSHTKDYKEVTLKWNPVIDENFDNYEPFARTIPGWTFEDKDGKPTYGFSNVDFPGEGYTGSYIVFDAHSEYLLQVGNGFNAISGRNVLGCVAAIGAANNDWIISPVFKVQDGDELSFMARSFNDAYGLEKFNVLVSIQEPSPQAYVNISGGTKEAPTTWTPYSYSLQNYVGKQIRVAIQCVSNDVFIFLLDRIKIGPASPGLVSSFPPLQVEGPSLSKKIAVSVPEEDALGKSVSQVQGQITPGIGTIGYTVMLGDEVVGVLNGFTQNSIKANVEQCSGNMFSIKANYLVEGVSSEWTDYTADACYSVIFSVKSAQLLPVTGALVNLDGRTQLTDAQGQAVFHGFEPVTGLPYTISCDGYENFSGTLNIVSANRELNITLAVTSIRDILLNGAEVKLFPNPATNELYIQGILPGTVELQIFDLGGRLSKNVKYDGGGDLRIDLNGLTPGVYMVVLKQANDVWRQKLVVIP